MRNIQWGKILVYGIVCLLLVGMSFQACDRLYLYLEIQPDNKLEEVLEDVIKEETGIELDISGQSPEKVSRKEETKEKDVKPNVFAIQSQVKFITR